MDILNQCPLSNKFPIAFFYVVVVLAHHLGTLLIPPDAYLPKLHTHCNQLRQSNFPLSLLYPLLINLKL